MWHITMCSAPIPLAGPILEALQSRWQYFADLSSWWPTASCDSMAAISCDDKGNIVSL